MLSRNENIHTKLVVQNILNIIFIKHFHRTLIPEKIRKDKSITEWECRPEASKIARQMADRYLFLLVKREEFLKKRALKLNFEFFICIFEILNNN